MAKWVDLPTNLWYYIKIIHEKFVPQRLLINDILKISGGFICHAVPTIDEFKLFADDKILYFLFGFFILLVPPANHESHLYYHELFRRVFT